MNSCLVSLLLSFLQSIAIHRLHSPGAMIRLAIDTHRRVVILSKNGFTLLEIKAHLEEEDMHISNNKEKQLDWCRKMLRDKESFDNVLWMDTSSVMLELL